MTSPLAKFKKQIREHRTTIPEMSVTYEIDQQCRRRLIVRVRTDPDAGRRPIGIRTETGGFRDDVDILRISPDVARRLAAMLMAAADELPPSGDVLEGS